MKKHAVHIQGVLVLVLGVVIVVLLYEHKKMSAPAINVATPNVVVNPIVASQIGQPAPKEPVNYPGYY